MNMIFEDMTKVSHADKLKYAKEFAEESNTLKQLLLYLWDNNINTIACCAGHNIYDQPYISISVDNLSSELIKIILSNIFYNYKTRVKILIRHENNRKKKKDYLKHIIKLTLFFDYSEKDSCFKYLQNIINSAFKNQLISKQHLLNEFEQMLLDDIITVCSLDMLKYERDNPFEDIVAIGIFDLYPEKFSITNRELYETKCFNKDKRTIISKNSYMIEDEKYYIYSDGEIKEVSFDYIEKNNIPYFENIKGTNIFTYDHQSFCNAIKELNLKYNAKKPN